MQIGTFIQAAFEVLESQAPKSLHRILGLLTNIRLTIAVGEDSQTLAFSRTGLLLNPATDIADAYIQTSKPCIRDLVDGRVGLVEAIKSDRFYVRCPIADLGRLHQAFIMFLQSSLRSSEIHDLYSNYCGER